MRTGIEVAERGFAPEPRRDLLVRYQFLPVLQQQEEQLHWLSRESNAAAVTPQFVRRHIELEVPEAEGHAGSGGTHARDR